jgi:hypothetical protein
MRTQEICLRRVKTSNDRRWGSQSRSKITPLQY